jgi:hypothetical protein
MGGSRAIKLWVAAWLSCGLGVLVASAPALADTITVTNTSDAGAGSLRQAIIDVMPGGTIVVPPGSYGLASGELAISKSLTISGAGAGSTIISNVGSSRVFHTTGSGDTITISAVTIRLGHPPTTMGAVMGGGVLNDAAKLTLSDDVIADNQADANAAGTGGSGGVAQGGGVFNGGGGTLVVHDCEIVDNKATAVGASTKPGGLAEGGGIITGGTQTIEGSTFSGNLADADGGAGASGGISHGGGLEVAAVGVTSLLASTFNGNAADASAGTGGTSGGGAEGGGAFMLTNAPAMSATNVTFTGNLARTTAGGIAEAGGLSFGSNGPVITLTNATMSANTATGSDDATGGDAALGGATTVVENTIVSAGAADSGSENCTGTPRSAGHNLDSLDQCNFHANGDRVNIDPLLGPLSDNGGPVTTMALRPGSPAIDAGANAACPATDARGVLRPAALACDIGAFEVATPAATTRPAGSITTGTAVLNGSASNPDLLPATAHLQFGTTTAYGLDTTPQQISPVTVGAQVMASISGLAPSTVFHFRLVVSNSTGTVFGSDQTFTTASAPASPPALRAPQISGLTLSPSAFVAASRGAAVTSVTTGSTVSYSDSVAATATFTVELRATGRLVGDSCLRVTKRNHSRKHCTRLVTIGHFNHADLSGSNRFHFTGRVGGRKLAPHRYLLVAVARNAAGAGPAVTVGFAVKRALALAGRPARDGRLRDPVGVALSGSARSSWFREVTSSLENTLRRW